MNLGGFCGIFVAWLAVAVMAQGQTWMSQGVGNVGVSGSCNALSADAFSITGSGTDIGGTADAFQFVYQTLPGDGEVVARVVSVPKNDPLSKAGLCVRESLDANAKNASLVVTRDNGIQFWSRSATGGFTFLKATASYRIAPQWLKVIRTGTTFATYASNDGVVWGGVGSCSVPMTGTLYVGMAVTSHANTQLGTAMFDCVSIGDGTVTDVSAPPTPVLSIGEKSKAGIALSWRAVTDDVGVSSYEVRRNGVVVATLQGAASSYIDSLLAPSTVYSYIVRALDASGKASELSNTVSGSTHAASNDMLSAFQDIGYVALSGSTTYNAAASTYTIAASGANIGGTSDSFHFAYNPCSGDTEVVSRISGMTSYGAKTGVMIRESLNANAPAASMIWYYKGVMFQSRRTAGGTTLVSSTIPALNSLNWLKLVRLGNVFKGYTSADGVNWQYVGIDTIAMASNAYVGLSYTSFNNSSRYRNPCVFVCSGGNAKRGEWTRKRCICGTHAVRSDIKSVFGGEANHRDESATAGDVVALGMPKLVGNLLAGFESAARTVDLSLSSIVGTSNGGEVGKKNIACAGKRGVKGEFLGYQEEPK